jgi:hypothetical protein
MATEGIQLVRRQWWVGVAAACAFTVFLLPMGSWAAFSLGLGVFAVILGSSAAGWYTFRHRAPSGSQAAVSLMVAMVMRWMVVILVLVAAFLVSGIRPLWVVLGMVLGQVVSLVAALTFKRR